MVTGFAFPSRSHSSNQRHIVRRRVGSVACHRLSTNFWLRTPDADAIRVAKLPNDNKPADLEAQIACERKGWAEEAGYYNSLVVAWPCMASEAFEMR